MPTKPKPKPDPEASIGHSDMIDRHPLIVHAIHVHGGHAVFRDIPTLTVERVLRTLAKDLARDAHRAAALRYAAEIVESLSALPPEVLTHLQLMPSKRGRR